MNTNLFKNIVLVNGEKRSLLMDLQRKKYHLIPNSFYDILKSEKDLSYSSLMDKYGKENENVINEYTKFLDSNELTFESSIADQFPVLNTEFNIPSKVSNCIIEFSKSIKYEGIIKELAQLNCKALELRIYDVISKKSLSDFLDLCNEYGRFTSVAIYVKDKVLDIEDVRLFCFKYQIISHLIIHSANVDSLEQIEAIGTIIQLTKTAITETTHCGFIEQSDFRVDSKFYFESLSKNNCLNKKMSINVLGDIKNCPSMSKVHGNVKTDSLVETLKKKDFKEYWDINKNMVETCKSCEFRYICLDCRAFTEKGNKHGKPLNCKYNPKTALWED